MSCPAIPTTDIGPINVVPLDPTKDLTYAVLADVLDTVAESFPDAFVHTGGDELQYACWMSNKNITDWMRANNMTKPEELDRHFTARLAAMLADRGRRSLVWDEAYSDMGVPIEFAALALGDINTPIFIRILGSSEPPLEVTLSARARGPDVSADVESLSWGSVPVLARHPKTIVIRNNSLIPANFRCVFGARRPVFSVGDQVEGVIQPRKSFSLTVYAVLDDVSKFSDLLSVEINGGETDQLICPQIALPGDFDTYLEGQSRNTRKKIRKTMRRYFDSGEVTPRVLEEVPYEEVRDALLSHWAARWREANSPERLETVGAKYRRMLDRARDLGLLYMPSLWHQGRVVGALGFVIDPASGAYHCMVTGRDIEVQAIDLGLLMHAHAIEDVIGRGGTLYDFGHGTEPYKFHYATSTLELGNLVIERRAGGVFDPAMTGAALARCEQMLRRGQTEDLARALRQLRKAGAAVG